MHEQQSVPNWRLRAAREKRLWTIEQACERVGASRNAYYRWERGLQYPNMSSLTRLHEVFGLSPEELGFTRRALAPGEETSTTQAIQPAPEVFLSEPAVNEVYLLPSMCTQGIPAETTAVDRAIHLGMQLEKIIMLVTHPKGKAMSWSEHQATIDRIDQELDMFDALKPQQISEEYTISRRQAIISVATLPFALLPTFWQGQRHVLIMEELLSRCAASIAALWHLMKGNDFAVVGQVLSAYLPALKKMAQEPSSYQQTAASLALQGYTLEGLLAHHRNQLLVRVAYDKQAVQYGRLTENHTQLVGALHQLARGLSEGHPLDALQTLQEALLHLDKVPPILQSGVYARLAWVHAQCKQEQEALRYQSLAREAFFEQFPDTSIPHYVDYGIADLYLCEGKTFSDLAQHYPDSEYRQKAWNSFAEVEKLPATIIIPERIRIEVFNHQAMTANALRDLDAFYIYLEKGIIGAKRLGSEKRRQEAIDAYRQGRSVWPNEVRVRELADLLLN